MSRRTKPWLFLAVIVVGGAVALFGYTAGEQVNWPAVILGGAVMFGAILVLVLKGEAPRDENVPQNRR